MENHPLKGRPWRAQALVVLILAASCLAFFLVYVPNKKASLTEHNLRILGDMGDQIEAAIIGLNTSITNASVHVRDDDKNRQNPSSTKQESAPSPTPLTPFEQLSNSIRQI